MNLHKDCLPIWATDMSLFKGIQSHPVSYFPGNHYLSLPDSFPSLRDDLLSVYFYLNDIFLGLEKLSSPHKFIAFRWRLQEKKSTVPDSLTSGSFMVSKSPFSEKSVYSFWLSPGENRTYTHKRVSAAKSLQSYLTLCDTIDGSPPGSPVPGILQAKTLEWVAISSSNAWK